MNDKLMCPWDDESFSLGPEDPCPVCGQTAKQSLETNASECVATDTTPLAQQHH